MARIDSYPLDTALQDNDAWIGSDAITRRTKQYTPELLAEYLNITGKISVSGQMFFQFRTTLDPLNGQFTGPSDGSALANIATLKISGIDSSKEEIVDFMGYLVGNDILISEQQNTNTFGHFRVTSYTASDGFYILSLTIKKGNGNLIADKYYDFALLTLPTQGVPTFIFQQAEASFLWEIEHNLGKFPSCTIALSTGQQGYGEVTFIDQNNITVTLASPESGNAYLN
tara:strand:- start:1757 stop:2440 length:684 start_codon:yes stop_codon:yes gene_type:complete